MDNVVTVVNGAALLLGLFGGAVAVFFVVYSGFLFITAQGDPQRSAQARSSLLGVAVGLVVIGGAFLIPATISRFVIEPAGGTRVEPRASFDCDGLLQDQLVFQRSASTPERMGYVVSRIQAQRDECVLESWSPVVKQDPGIPYGCQDGWKIGALEVPEESTLRVGGSLVNVSSRDSDNNLIVYWTSPLSTDVEATGLPADGAVCWFYRSDFKAWSRSYYASP